MAGRRTKFDLNQPQLGLQVDNTDTRIVPVCSVCGNFASWGFRAPGWTFIQVDTEIWTCFDHRADGPALLERLLNTASTIPTGSQSEGPAGASPEKGCPDQVAEGRCGCGPHTGSRPRAAMSSRDPGAWRAGRLDDPLSDPDDDTL
jgi:hypothetical protein